jgi:phospholipase D1/2
VPVVPGPEGPVPVYVHAKVMVVDDVLARVGSANLSNRSMGFDTECDLAVEAEGQGPVAAGIRQLRDRLLAEHLGVSPDVVATAIAERGSLIAAIEALPSWLVEALPSRQVIDPERPLDFEQWVAESVPRKVRAEAEVNLQLMGALALVASAAVVAWSGSSLAARWAALVPDSGTTLGLWLLLCYVVATVVPVPTTWLTVVAVLAFDLFAGWGLATLGLMLNAMTGFAVGRWLARDTVRRLAGKQLNRVSRRLAKQGMFAVVALRILPVTPFAVVGLVAGASRVRFADYALGTLLGALPTAALVGLLVDRLVAAVRSPDPVTVAVSAVVFGLAGAGALGVARRLNATLRRGPPDR